MDGKILIRVRAIDAQVALQLDDKAAGLLAWEAAQVAARELRALAGAAVGMVFYKFMLDGRPVYVDLEPALALRVSEALHSCGLLAEEWAKAKRIVLDTAILYRAGAPFGLSNHPAIIDEAKKEAAWNSGIRRCMPGGVKSAEAFGVPAVLRGPPLITKH